MKRLTKAGALLLMMLIVSALSMSAQSPVQWKTKVQMTSADEGVIYLTANIDKGWHMYGFNQPEDGPVSTSMTMAVTKGVTFTDVMRYSPKPLTVMDDMFGVEVSYWEDRVTLSRKFKLNGVQNATATINITYMACNESSCMPPKTETITLKLK